MYSESEAKMRKVEETVGSGPWPFIPPSKVPEREGVCIPLGTGRYQLYVCPEMHQYLIYYPNEVFMIGLLGSHPIFHPTSDAPPDGASASDAKDGADILSCQFSEALRSISRCDEVQVNNALKLNKGAGSSNSKKKDPVMLPGTQPLCTFTLSNGETYPIEPCVRGKGLTILEINLKISIQADLIRSIFESSEEFPDLSGYLAIMTIRKPDFVIRDHFAVKPLHLVPMSSNIKEVLIGPESPKSCKRLRTV